MRDPVQEFMEFNRPFAQRNAGLLQYKVARMAENPFAFFRGTFHLFARDVLTGVSGPLPLLTGEGSEMDVVGDLHSENYGTFKADDGLVHYDINDFDETTTGRFDFDVCRLAVSLFLAARDRRDPLERAVLAPLAAVQTYSEALRRLLTKGKGQPEDVNERTASGCEAIDTLVREAAAVRRPAFIGKLTQPGDKKRTLIRSVKYFNLADAERTQALRLLEDYRTRHGKEEHEGFWKVEDVCGRVSGIGSMGRYRYVVLLAGKGSEEARNVLLEFKEARPSAYDLYRNRDTGGDALRRRAERVVTMQRQSQAASNRHLGHAVDGETSFQVRQLGPQDARVEAGPLKPGGLEAVGRVQATILARVHARSALRAVGPTNPLAELAEPEAFNQRVLAFALSYADLVWRDWARFVGARAEIDRVEGWVKGK
jgi:uncharacterized protein (DUF2252 family)